MDDTSRAGNRSLSGRIAIILIASTVLSFGVILFGLSVTTKIIDLNDVWLKHNRAAASESSLLNDIRTYMGYGGFIHKFKNYVLRHDANLLEQMDVDFKRTIKAIDEYSRLNITAEESLALEDLRSVVLKYAENIKIAQDLISQGVVPAKLDSIVRIDDEPALFAIQQLNEAAHLKAEKVKSETRKVIDSVVHLVSFAGILIPLFFLVAWLVVRFTRQVMYATQEANDAREDVDRLLNSAPDTILVVDVNGRIVRVNSTACLCFGYSNEEFLELEIEDLIPASHRDAHVRLRNGFMKNATSRIMGNERVFFALHKSGYEIPVEIGLSYMQRSKQSFAIATVRDITVRHNLDKMKNEFVSIVSHELRTPLTSIHGALGLLRDMKEIDNKLVDISYRNSGRLIALVNDLLDMEKFISGKVDFNVEAFSLKDLLEEAIRDNEPFASQYKVNLCLVENAADLNVDVDYHRMLQVMSNLLSNAVKFSPENSNVNVSFTVEKTNAVINVADFGPGIAEGYEKRIFDKFQQVGDPNHRQNTGTGLGLAISKAIIEKLNGSIWFENGEKGGATFFVRLPLSTP